MAPKEPKHWSRCPYNVDPVDPVSSPGSSFAQLKSNLHEMQGGSFIVQTNSYYTVSRVTNEKGLNVLAGDGNERQFRMKLPEKSICAFLAIGCRLVAMRLCSSFYGISWGLCDFWPTEFFWYWQNRLNWDKNLIDENCQNINKFYEIDKYRFNRYLI